MGEEGFKMYLYYYIKLNPSKAPFFVNFYLLHIIN